MKPTVAELQQNIENKNRTIAELGNALKGAMNAMDAAVRAVDPEATVTPYVRGLSAAAEEARTVLSLAGAL